MECGTVLSDVLDIRGLKTMTIRGQEFFDRKVRKLYDFRTLDIDNDGDESGTRGELRLLWVFRSPIFHPVSSLTLSGRMAATKHWRSR